MRKITDIRKALDQIPGARINFTPEEDFLGNEEGVQIETIYRGDLENQVRQIAESSYSDLPSSQSHEDDGSGLASAHEPEFIFEYGAENDSKRRLLGGDGDERIRKSIEVKGMDALGCYLSFHVNRAQWGIYISASGIDHMANNAFNGLNVSREIKSQLSFKAILNHELFHFATDYMVAQLEMFWGEPAWVHMKMRLREQDPNYLEREEKLANAYMLKRFRSGRVAAKVKGKMESLRRFVTRQPSGYREGAQVRPSDWDAELKLLANDYHFFEAVTMFDFPIEWSALYFLKPWIDWRYCPIHLIHDEHRLEIPEIYLNLFTRIEHIEESASFQRKIGSLPSQIQKKWGKFKSLSFVRITPGMRPERWPQAGEDVYSFRVDQDYRVHLKLHTASGKWMALEIGNHAAMGHG